MKPTLNPGTSWYLDILRALSAIYVLIIHVAQVFYPQGHPWMPNVSHEVVVIFFVLSGFVMAYVSQRQDSNWQSYFIARFSRIASVAYLALVLTIICDFFGRLINPSFYEEIAQSAGYWLRILLSAFFLQQSGSFAASPGSNGPFWSLAYEVWYYILLGLWLFVPDKRPLQRFFILLLGVTLAGPKILLLLPVWISGIFAFKLTSRYILPVSVSILLFFASSAFLLSILSGTGFIWGYTDYDVPAIPPLFWSSGFLRDYFVGLLVAVNLLGADQLMRYYEIDKINNIIDLPTRYLATRSFSLYAFHMPLLYLISVSLPYRTANNYLVILSLSIMFPIILLLHSVSENRRQDWRNLSQKALFGLLNFIQRVYSSKT